MDIKNCLAPEFVELEWDEIKSISCVEQVSIHPMSFFTHRNHNDGRQNFKSLVKNYRLYAMARKKSQLLVDVCDNQVAFRSHSLIRWR